MFRKLRVAVVVVTFAAVVVTAFFPARFVGSAMQPLACDQASSLIGGQGYCIYKQAQMLSTCNILCCSSGARITVGSNQSDSANVYLDVLCDITKPGCGDYYMWDSMDNCSGS